MKHEDRFGNSATITNAFLSKLRELSKFSDEEKTELEAFSHLCIDIAAQVNHSPGLAYLNYPNVLHLILSNLPEFICGKWNNTIFSGTVEEDKKSRYCYYHKTDSHDLIGCTAFSNLAVDEKTEVIKKTKLCFWCLSPDHIAEKCKVRIKCSRCDSECYQNLPEEEKDIGQKSQTLSSIGCQT